MAIAKTGLRKGKSNLEHSRRKGKHQIDEQRASILDAAEKLFLQKGIEGTKMIDIAAGAGITKITLYRYFPNRDVIALEIQARMMRKVAACVGTDKPAITLPNAREMAQAMIRNFEPLRDAYRYIGLFDKLYLDNPPNSAIAQWTKKQLLAMPWPGIAPLPLSKQDSHSNRFHMVLSTVVWFLEKLALRGELTWSDQRVPLATHLQLFEEMIVGYIDQFLDDE